MISFPQLRACHLCPHDCGVDRYRDVGFCGAGPSVKVNLAQLHFGEEPIISGSRGSGTIFFAHCNLRCVFCQNYSISHLGWGDPLSPPELASMMLNLQTQGAHNINLVSPTHFSPQIRAALVLAKENGLQIPVLWNSNAYEKAETLATLEGLVDIWLPDFKYAHAYYAEKYSRAKDYPARALDAIEEMLKQAGFLHTDTDGLATQGVVVRHLVLPHMLAGSCDALRLLRDRFGEQLTISLMAQYYPAGKAASLSELQRGITASEYERVLDCAQNLGFVSVFAQEISCDDSWTPRFKEPGALASDGL